MCLPFVFGFHIAFWTRFLRLNFKQEKYLVDAFVSGVHSIIVISKILCKTYKQNTFKVKEQSQRLKRVVNFCCTRIF